MKSEKTGTSMSRIENTRLISAVYCDCKKCFHSVNKNGMLYCKYYDLFSPKKKKCARYSFLDKGKKKRISPKEKPKRVKRNLRFHGKPRKMYLIICRKSKKWKINQW